METKEITITEYYNNPKYYPVMPEVVFNAWKLLFWKVRETAEVPKKEYERMLLAIQEKNK